VTGANSCLLYHVFKRTHQPQQSKFIGRGEKRLRETPSILFKKTLRFFLTRFYSSGLSSGLSFLEAELICLSTVFPLWPNLELSHCDLIIIERRLSFFRFLELPKGKFFQ
jgi:hypothetical protein